MEENVYTSHKKNNNYKGVIIGVFFLLVTIVVIYWATNYRNQINQSSQTPTKQSPTTVNVPIAVDDPAVNLAGISYSLSGKIGFLKSVSNNQWQLTFIGRSGASIFNPPLTITDKTLITNATGSAKLKPTDLKTDQSIFLNYFYDLVHKTGTVTSIQVQ